MSPQKSAPRERWSRLEELFFDAANLPDREREPFLERSCGDDTALRAEILSLLEWDAMREPEIRLALGAGAASVLGPAGSVEERVFGSWRVVRELGRGGMSTVFLATRADGEFRREVAIKLIKRGMDTDAVIERLRRERQILASLDHPGIARLLDGGSTAAGLPWIAMEYVDGVPVTRWCEARKPGIPERCRLVANICDVVGYAHRNLVVHRDLKPGNILVTPEGEPKLLDFGIAKALSPDMVEGSALTQEFCRPFTPQYASPEQIAGRAVGTASDIYSLGVILYELVAGERPNDAQDEASVAAARNGRSRREIRRIRGDLDTILQMALRLEPERRYLTVQQFALDLRRFVDGLPVAARRETIAYRAGKFIGRHRFACSGAAAALIAGIAGAGLYVHQTRLAARRFDELHHFANGFLFDVDDRLRTLPDSTAARAAVAQQALAYLTALAAEKTSDRQLQREAGNAWRRVGEVQGDTGHSSLGDTTGARQSYEKSIEILAPLAAKETGPRKSGDTRGDLVQSLVDLAFLERTAGNTARAKELIVRALPVVRSGASAPNPELQADLGVVLGQYAWALQVTGQDPESLVAATEAVNALEPAARANPARRPDLADALSVLGGTEMYLGRGAEALEHYRRNLAVRQEIVAANPADRRAKRDLMLAWSHLGQLLSDNVDDSANDPKASGDAYVATVRIARELAASDQTDRTARMDLAIALDHAGEALSFFGHYEEAVSDYRESATILRQMTVGTPQNRRIREYLANALGRMGTADLKLGRKAEGRAGLEQALDIDGAILKADPNATTDWIAEFRWFWELGQAYADSGEHDRVMALIHRVEPGTAIFAAQANSDVNRGNLANFWQHCGELLDRTERRQPARSYYEKSVAAWSKIGNLPKIFAGRPELVKARLEEQ